MVDLPRESLDGEFDDAASSVDRQAAAHRRRTSLKVDYLRECHTVHSRKSKSKGALREPEAILLQIVMLLASANRYTEALNELELYLPLYPYRDNALLHYYAGLLCIYLAQLELIQSQERSLARSGSQAFTQVFTSGSQYGSTVQPTQAASSVRSLSEGTGRSRSSSASSSSSSSSTSSSANSTPQPPKLTASSQMSSTTRKRPRHRVHARVKGALSFSDTPTPALIQKVLQASPTYAYEATKWFDLAKKITQEKREQFSDLEEWLGLMNGKSVEETRAQRKSLALKRMDMAPAASTPRDHRGHTHSTSPPSAVSPPLKSPRLQLKTDARTTTSSARKASPLHYHGDDEEADMTMTASTHMRTLSSRHGTESSTHTATGAADEVSDDEDDGDPFGRTKEERRKRKRNDRMVSFARVDTDGFDLDISD